MSEPFMLLLPNHSQTRAQLWLICHPNPCTNVFTRGRHATVRITYPQHLTPSVTKIPSNYQVHIWYGKTRMAGLQSGEGRMMIDSRRLGTTHQCDRHTDSHVATAIAALTCSKHSGSKSHNYRQLHNTTVTRAVQLIFSQTPDQHHSSDEARKSIYTNSASEASRAAGWGKAEQLIGKAASERACCGSAISTALLYICVAAKFGV